MNGIIATFFLVVLHQVSASSYRNVVSIYQQENCTFSSNNIEFFPDIQDDTEIIFCERYIILNKSVVITGKRHIKISGETTVNCSGNSGLVFEDVTNLTISNLALINCRVSYPETITGASNIVKYSASIVLSGCANVLVERLNITHSTDIDLYILNAHKEVQVTESEFIFNCSGIGVQIEFTEQKENNPSNIQLTDCTFKHKKILSYISSKVDGGGLKIKLGKLTANNNAKILRCNFINLPMRGIHILVSSDTRDNEITVTNSSLIKNTCGLSGGGGLRIDIHNTPHNIQSSGNRILIINSKFIGNKARHGGAVLINSSKPANRSSTDKVNTIEFCKCNWTKNEAHYGSAVDALVSKGMGELILSTIFRNCSFDANRIKPVRSNNSLSLFGQGTVCVINFRVTFAERTSFFKNRGTPIFLSSSYADFTPNSHTQFLNNSGLNGGGVSILGPSAIRAMDGSRFNFTDNTAYFKGGAIYYRSTVGHDYLTSRHCFIQYFNQSLNSKRPSFTFMDNTAGFAYNKNDSLGKSIYATTLVPCNKICNHYYTGSKYRADKNNSFDCIGKFTYFNNRTYELATAAWKIKTSQRPLDIIPGKEFELSIHTTDEFGQELNAVYKVTLWNNNSTETKASILSPYRYIHNNKIALRGEPSGNVFKLVLTTEHNREMRITIKVQIIPCPPGYMLNGTSLLCQCSVEMEARYHYEGIILCDSVQFQAKRQSGYWVGYSNESYKSLITSICPRGFCSVNYNSPKKYYILPKRFNINELDRSICDDNRTGRLCAKCRGNTSVYYHSSSYKCETNRLCKVGWIFYGVSELLPVTIVFIAVVKFNIQLTSGTMGSLILYYQLLDTMLVTGNSLIKFPRVTYIFYKIHRFLAQIFNLDFFTYRELSFCLWEGAETLDIIAFKYVTIIYALCMVFVTVILKSCNQKVFCLKSKRLMSKNKITNSVIHGLSGFFVLCYSECTLISLLLLKPIKYNDPLNTLDNTKYLLYNGEMQYLSGEHMKYALPAIFFALVIVIIPPMLLIAYPLCYRIFAVFGIGESEYIRILCQIVPLEKFKPFYDSFQGTFKDKHRYTSGLFFIYRLTAVCLAVFTTHSIDLFYTLFEIQLLLMIFIHAYCQPHKLVRHNKQDLFIFVTMAVINALTFFNLKNSVDVTNQQCAVRIASSIQTFIIYLPTIYFTVKIGYWLCVAIRGRCTHPNEERDNEILTERVSDDELSNNYNMMLDQSVDTYM